MPDFIRAFWLTFAVALGTTVLVWAVAYWSTRRRW